MKLIGSPASPFVRKVRIVAPIVGEIFRYTGTFTYERRPATAA